MSGTENSLISIFTVIFAWYHLFLMVSSIILNPLVAFVCIKSRNLRSTSTFKLLAFNSINDIMVCFEWNLADFVNTAIGYNLSRRSLVYCRLATYFLQYSTLNLSSWMYVSISLDRLLSLSLADWTRVHFARFRPYYYSALLAAIMFAVNFNEVFTVGYSFVANDTEVVVCNMNTNGSFPWNIVMAQISIYFGNIIPFCLLLIFNALIIYKATKFVRKRRSATSIVVTKRRAQMTRTILFITFLYIALTLPGALIGGFFYTDIIALQAGPLIVSAINAVQFTYPALNFFILYFSNNLFAQQAKLLLFKCSSN